MMAIPSCFRPSKIFALCTATPFVFFKELRCASPIEVTIAISGCIKLDIDPVSYEFKALTETSRFKTSGLESNLLMYKGTANRTL